MEKYLNHFGDQETPPFGVVFMASTVTEIEELTGSFTNSCGFISAFIDDVNKKEKEIEHPETMKPRNPDKIAGYFMEERAVMALEWQSKIHKYVPIGFCALTYELAEGPIYEIGSIVKSPTTKQKGIGALIILAALELFKAKSAKSIIAYCNNISLSLALKLGASIISQEELASNFPYLKPYSGDTIVDFTPIRDSLLKKGG